MTRRYEGAKCRSPQDLSLGEQLLYDQARKNAVFGDWTIHYIMDSFPKVPGLVDSHTHGLERFGLPNLALFLRIPPNETQKLLNTIAWLGINGNAFDPGVRYSLTDESNRPIWIFHLDDIVWHARHMRRVILCDHNGSLPGLEDLPVLAPGRILKDYPYLAQAFPSSLLERLCHASGLKDG